LKLFFEDLMGRVAVPSAAGGAAAAVDGSVAVAVVERVAVAVVVVVAAVAPGVALFAEAADLDALVESAARSEAGRLVGEVLAAVVAAPAAGTTATSAALRIVASAAGVTKRRGRVGAMVARC
jgi:hypothetical protein